MSSKRKGGRAGVGGRFHGSIEIFDVVLYFDVQWLVVTGFVSVHRDTRVQKGRKR